MNERSWVGVLIEEVHTLPLLPCQSLPKWDSPLFLPSWYLTTALINSAPGPQFSMSDQAMYVGCGFHLSAEKKRRLSLLFFIQLNLAGKWNYINIFNILSWKPKSDFLGLMQPTFFPGFVVHWKNVSARLVSWLMKERRLIMPLALSVFATLARKELGYSGSISVEEKSY